MGGVVQGYEVLETAELPALAARRSGVQWTPEGVANQAYSNPNPGPNFGPNPGPNADQAHSVLRFLQSHCGNDGATYILRKAQPQP